LVSLNAFDLELYDYAKVLTKKRVADLTETFSDLSSSLFLFNSVSLPLSTDRFLLKKNRPELARKAISDNIESRIISKPSSSLYSASACSHMSSTAFQNQFNNELGLFQPAGHKGP
jgi:hypothetical protein